MGESTLPTPAQLRPAHDWSPATPAELDEPPAYGERPLCTLVPRAHAAAPSPFDEEGPGAGAASGSSAPCSGAYAGNREEYAPTLVDTTQEDGNVPLPTQLDDEMPRFTDADEADIPDSKDTFVFGGEEVKRPGRIPTPARSRRPGCWEAASSGGAPVTRRPEKGGSAAAASVPAVGRQQVDAAVQVNRTSLDGCPSVQPSRRPSPNPEGVRPEAEGGAGVHCSDVGDAAAGGSGSSAAGTPRGLLPDGTGEAGNSLDIGDLLYPAPDRGLRRPAPREAEPECLASWEGRTAMARALTEAVSAEFEELDEAWELGGEEDEQLRPTERAVASFLRKVARRAERACVLQVLRPSSALSAAQEEDAPEEAELEARRAALEASVAAADSRLARLADLAQDLAEQRRRGGGTLGTEACEDLREVTAHLSREVNDCEEGSAAAQGALEASAELQQCAQRLALLELYLQRTLVSLEERRQDLAERERAVASQAFAHLPGGGPDGLRALASLR